jgi:arylsulfatase A-like enzyme
MRRKSRPCLRRSRGKIVNKLSRLFPIFLFLTLAACSDSLSSKPPNVVLIVFDALRPDHTGALGYERPTTPNLDRLAEHAVLFESAVPSAAFTLPSMATIFTSLNPVKHGVRRHLDPYGIEDRLDSRFTTLAELLRERGYATAAVVSNSLFVMDTGFEQGFDLFDPSERRDAGPTTDAALKWLHERGDDRPYFLWVHYIDPHWPYNAPPGFKRPFTPPDEGEYESLLRGFKQGRVDADRIYFENRLSEAGLKRGIAEYDNEIAYMDLHLGRLLDRVDREDTLIAAVSDHGESMGEHGLFFAHSFYLYNAVQKAVMVIKPPGWKGRARVSQTVRLLDLLPTLLGLAGIDGPKGMEGVDLSPLWEDPGGEPWNLPVYAESEPRYYTPEDGFRYPARKRAYLEGNMGKWRMMQSGGYKLILIPGEGCELYDVEADPGETENLFEARPDTAASLGRKLGEVLKDDRFDAAQAKRVPLEQDEKALRLLKELGYGN